MKRWVVIEKRIGETPLRALEAWRAASPAYAGIPASYAGRLDPMASGKLLILLGDECKKQERYTGLDKEYEIEVLLDIGTDTGDVLGVPTYVGTKTSVVPDAALRAVTGAHVVPYPAFSSRTVNGKPLFLHTLEGNPIKIPTHEETVYRIRRLSESRVSKEDLKARIEDLLTYAPRSDEPSKALGADFRQDEIREAWGAVFAQMPDRSFTILRLRVTCASGTYMRTLASRFGAQGLALSIHRTKIGQFLPFLGVWMRNF
ncbi:MAG TPA: hypothetical protein VEA36_00025 [Candidatus Paceibacterota bacterium]|nr:hypothetical protein [Candidatus Paceibacterota bacterium]